MAETLEIQERRRGTRCCESDVQPRMSQQEVEQVHSALQILAHPIRLQILDILARNDGQICVCDLESALPVKQPTISHHLKLLRDAGLIDCERHGLWAYYYLKNSAIEELRARIVGQLDAFRV